MQNFIPKDEDEVSDIEAFEYAQEIMGESNNNSKNEKSWLVETVMEIVSAVEKDLHVSQFKFEDTLKGAGWNAKILAKYDYDLEKAIKSEPNTILTPGSEFRDIKNIEKIWKFRKKWPEIRSILVEGCIYPLKEGQTEEVRKKDLAAMVARGNHKSALTPEHIIVLEKIQKKEVSQGFTFPVTIDCLMKMKGAAVIPMGVHDQWSINESGERIVKPRACHDASFPTPSGYSVNLDHDSDLLSPCIYGQCLRRVLHDIHIKRLKYPQTIIYLIKYDFDAAYRRVHVCPAHAVKTMIIIGSKAYILNRLPFGVESGPSKYSAVSEGIFDLANDLLEDQSWDHNKLFSPLQSDFSEKNVPDRQINFDEAKELCVEVPFCEAKCDGYINDAILVALDIKKM